MSISTQTQLTMLFRFKVPSSKLQATPIYRTCDDLSENPLQQGDTQERLFFAVPFCVETWDTCVTATRSADDIFDCSGRLVQAPWGRAMLQWLLVPVLLLPEVGAKCIFALEMHVCEIHLRCWSYRFFNSLLGR